MKTALLVFIAICICGCGEARKPAVPGPIAAPPASANVTAPTESLIAGQANASASGDTKTAKAIGKALIEQDRQEVAGSNRWIIFTGIIIAAVGFGIMYYAGPKLGGGVAIIGGGMVGGALFVSAILPYIGWIVASGSLVALAAAAWHFRAYASALGHMAHNTEHLASDHVRALIGKIRARGPSIATRIKALLHHAPMGQKAP